jgi:hypothetical protein
VSQNFAKKEVELRKVKDIILPLRNFALTFVLPFAFNFFQ